MPGWTFRSYAELAQAGGTAPYLSARQRVASFAGCILQHLVSEVSSTLDKCRRHLDSGQLKALANQQLEGRDSYANLLASATFPVLFTGSDHEAARLMPSSMSTPDFSMYACVVAAPMQEAFVYDEHVTIRKKKGAH
eukprot:4871212-Amphidinium_carterae.1